jgi:transcriptional regulator with XRE-family HTH domain
MTGQEIQKKRLELGLSQAQLADKFGVEPNMLQDWETGKANPPYPKILEYAFLGLESECDFDDETLADFERIRKLIDDGHKRMLETFPIA